MSKLRAAIESTKATEDRVAGATIDRAEVEVRLRLKGSGEVNAEVTFPVVFSERPFMTFGHELELNHSPEATNFPVCSATVLRWITKERSGDRVYYVGCDVGVVALGKASMESYALLLFKGKAFRGPTIQAPGAEDTI
jgi:hypothetical protein